MLRPAAVSRGLFSAAIAVALGFGASQLMASTQAASSTCPFDPANGNVGACSTQAACSQTCLSYFPENGGTGTCFRGCCLCAT
jgi:hypothetical protein